MSVRFYYFILFLFIQTCLNAKVIFVKAGATGSGSSWQMALGDLQSALQIAKVGDEIWVGKGVYFPTNNNDRTISFNISNGIALYGGFIGFETKKEERNTANHYSILSGEIGSDKKSDNTYNVLYTADITETTIIDGFIITGGYAGDSKKFASRFSSGAGWYHHSIQNKTSKVLVKNCRFIDNTARDGGAIFTNASYGRYATLDLIDCIFQQNKAFLGGGAIYNNGQQEGRCLLKIQKNKFSNNTAGFGGAIFNQGQEGNCMVEFQYCDLINNKAMLQGGAIFNLQVNGISKTKLINCTLKNNSAPKNSIVANSGDGIFDVKKRTRT